MKIPDAIIGGLVGSLLGLFSALLLEWVKSRRERRNKEHERELSLKKEAYLPLVNAFTEVTMLFGKIPQTPLEKFADLALSQASMNALGAVGLIASERVLGAVTEASKQSSIGMSRLISAKTDEIRLSLEIENIDTLIKQLDHATRLMADQRKALQDTGKLNTENVAMFASEIEQNISKMNGLFSDKEQKLKEKMEVVKQLNLLVMKEMVELTRKTAPAIIEIRKDLEIETDEDEMMRYFRDSIRFIDESYPGFVDELWDRATKNLDV